MLWVLLDDHRVGTSIIAETLRQAHGLGLSDQNLPCPFAVSRLFAFMALPNSHAFPYLADAVGPCDQALRNRVLTLRRGQGRQPHSSDRFVAVHVLQLGMYTSFRLFIGIAISFGMLIAFECSTPPTREWFHGLFSDDPPRALRFICRSELLRPQQIFCFRRCGAERKFSSGRLSFDEQERDQLRRI